MRCTCVYGYNFFVYIIIPFVDMDTTINLSQGLFSPLFYQGKVLTHKILVAHTRNLQLYSMLRHLGRKLMASDFCLFPGKLLTVNFQQQFQ